MQLWLMLAAFYQDIFVAFLTAMLTYSLFSFSSNTTQSVLFTANIYLHHKIVLSSHSDDSSQHKNTTSITLMIHTKKER